MFVLAGPFLWSLVPGSQCSRGLLPGTHMELQSISEITFRLGEISAQSSLDSFPICTLSYGALAEFRFFLFLCFDFLESRLTMRLAASAPS